MALEAICQTSKFPYMLNTSGVVAKHLEDQMKWSLSNFDNPYQLATPPFNSPTKDLKAIQARSQKIHYYRGTTTLAFKYQGGIIIAVDSRATGGQYIGSQSVEKVSEINNYLLGTMAGGAADCKYWQRILTIKCRLHELNNKTRMSARAASQMLSNAVYQYKDKGLSMGMMLAGYDGDDPALYFVDAEGTRCAGNMFSVGSGSAYAIGILDSSFRYDLNDVEAVELARRAMYHATFRDAYTGGTISIYRITSTGWENICSTDCKILYNEYNNKKHF